VTGTSNEVDEGFEAARQSTAAARGRGRQILLLEEGWGQTTYLASALEREGYQVTVATANDGATHHRHRSVTWRSMPAVDSAPFLPALTGLMKGTAFDHVLPLSEGIMQRLWDHAGAWSPLLYPATSEWQRRLLKSKHDLIDHMARLGVAVPQQRRLTTEMGAVDEAGLAELAREFGLPLVIKAATGAGGARVRVVESMAELEQAIAWTRAIGGEWVAQEFLSGATYLVGGVFHDGVALRIYAGEKVEQHPPRTGPAIRMRSDDHGALVGLGEQVFRELRWSGFGSADLIRRPDGRYVLLEVNPRPWGSIAGAAAAGVDLFTPFAALLAGEVPSADLAFAANRDCMIFPRYLLSPNYRNLAGARQAIRDLGGFQGRDWRQLRFVLHQLWRGLAWQRRCAST
jgi:ATP-grasp domain